MDGEWMAEREEGRHMVATLLYVNAWQVIKTASIESISSNMRQGVQVKNSQKILLTYSDCQCSCFLTACASALSHTHLCMNSTASSV